MEQSAGGGFIALIIQLAIMVFFIYCMWRVFTKAGQPGWAVLIPFYNAYIFFKVAGKPGWWLILMFIPIINIICAIIATVSLAERFGKGVPFAIGLILLGFIFYPILALSDAEYTPAPAV